LITDNDEAEVIKTFYKLQIDLNECTENNTESKLHFAKRLGRFNDRDDELRVVFAELTQDSNMMMQKLREKLVTKLEAHGILDTQIYKPHVTLLKTSCLPTNAPRRQPAAQLAAYLNDELSEIPQINGDQLITELELISITNGQTLARLKKEASSKANKSCNGAANPSTFIPNFVDSDGIEIARLPLSKRAPLGEKKPKKSLLTSITLTPPQVKNTPKIRLFCYGELMRLERFVKSGICGKPCPASLCGWSLTFDARGGRENIQPGGQPSVRGISYQVTEEALDIVRKHTASYAEIFLDCLQLDGNQQSQDCLVFIARQIMNKGCALNFLSSEKPKPPLTYVKILRDNARHFQLDAKYQQFLDELPIAEDRNKEYFKVHANPLLNSGASQTSVKKITPGPPDEVYVRKKDLPSPIDENNGNDSVIQQDKSSSLTTKKKGGSYSNVPIHQRRRSQQKKRNNTCQSLVLQNDRY